MTWCCDWSTVDSLVIRAHIGAMPLGRTEISIDEPQYRWILEHGALHVARRACHRTNSRQWVPREIGRPCCWSHFVSRRNLLETSRRVARNVRPFTPVQIKLLETFADQAVIALENVRLFQELKEALEQQTATSEILGVIASSPTDIQPVLGHCSPRVQRDMCDANDAVIRLVEGNVLRRVAHHGTIPAAG